MWERSRAVQRSLWPSVRAGGAGKETAVRALGCTTGGARSARAPQRTDWSPHERSWEFVSVRSQCTEGSAPAALDGATSGP